MVLNNDQIVHFEGIVHRLNRYWVVSTGKLLSLLRLTTEDSFSPSQIETSKNLSKHPKSQPANRKVRLHCPDSPKFQSEVFCQCSKFTLQVVQIIREFGNGSSVVVMVS